MNRSEYAAYFLEPEEVGRGSAVVRYSDGWLLFREPGHVEATYLSEEVIPLLQRVDEANSRGEWVVGFLAYEASVAMDPAIRVHPPETPLAWFAFYTAPPKLYRELSPVDQRVSLELVDTDFSMEEYVDRFDRVKLALFQGGAYQVNLTYRNRYRSTSGGFDLFRAWCGIDAPPHASFIREENWDVACLSPELFLERSGSHVTMRPMKGTASRGKSSKEEAQARSWLKGPKTLAENLMIVDMVRNDLGRIAEIGTVKTPSLMDVEIHRDLLQVTSTVTAESHVPNSELIRSVFPPASVTGAPKVASCNLIHELEASPRGIYCGAIGVWGPKRLDLAVAIRTAFISKAEPSVVTYGVGGGIVWDSDGEDEYREANLKLGPIQGASEKWSLVEAFHISASPELRRRHLDRLQKSAAELGILFDITKLGEDLETQMAANSNEKVRIALSRTGAFQISIGPSLLSGNYLKAHLASAPSNSEDPNYRIKTNAKGHYRAQKALFRDFDEVLFYNERGEVTEFSAGNVILKLEDGLVTPSRDSGLLFGITIRDLVAKGGVLERVVSLEEVKRAERVFVVNAVVGVRPIELGFE